MVRILFVCHGNICRSPMAEFILKDIAVKEGVADKLDIASAATSREELGNPVYPPAKRILAAHGIDCTGKRARQLTWKDYFEYDYLIGMDEKNLRNMTRICGGDPDGKLSLLMEYAHHPRDVADPWFTGDFDTAFREISSGCRGLYRHLIRDGII